MNNDEQLNQFQAERFSNLQRLRLWHRMASLQILGGTWGHTLIWHYSGRNFLNKKLIKFKTSWYPEHRDRLPAPPRHTLHPQYPHPPRCPPQLQSWTWFLSAGSDVFYPDISPLCRPTSHRRRHCNEHRLFFMRFPGIEVLPAIAVNCGLCPVLVFPPVENTNWKYFCQTGKYFHQTPSLRLRINEFLRAVL